MTILDEIRSAVREVRRTGWEPTMVVLNVEAADEFQVEVEPMLGSMFVGSVAWPADLRGVVFDGLPFVRNIALLAPRVEVLKRPCARYQTFRTHSWMTTRKVRT